MDPAPPLHPADHAEDFAHRYEHELEIATGQVMIDHRLADSQMGARDISRNQEHHTVYPGERDCGGVNRVGQITVDSGVMNLEAMDTPYGEECGNLWRKARLRHRLEAIIAHEKAEFDQGHDHERALLAAPDTDLPISPEARKILRAQKLGWKG